MGMGNKKERKGITIRVHCVLEITIQLLVLRITNRDNKTLCTQILVAARLPQHVYASVDTTIEVSAGIRNDFRLRVEGRAKVGRNFGPSCVWENS
jgi:hypothetical protein